MKTLRLVPVVVLVCLAGVAQATVLVTHTGANDPTTENPPWGLISSGGSSSGGTDTKPYWEITSNSGLYYQYGYELTTEQLSGLWSATVTVEIPVLGDRRGSTLLNVYTLSGWYGADLNKGNTWEPQPIPGFYTYNQGLGGWVNALNFTPSTSTYYTMKMQRTLTGVDISLFEEGNPTPLAVVVDSPGGTYAAEEAIRFGNSTASGVTITSRFNYAEFDDGVLPPSGTVILIQ